MGNDRGSEKRDDARHAGIRRAERLARHGRLEEALVELQGLVSQGPAGDAKVLYGVAYCHYKLGHWSEARLVAERAQNLGHPSAEVLLKKVAARERRDAKRVAGTPPEASPAPDAPDRAPAVVGPDADSSPPPVPPEPDAAAVLQPGQMPARKCDPRRLAFMIAAIVLGAVLLAVFVAVAVVQLKRAGNWSWP